MAIIYGPIPLNKTRIFSLCLAWCAIFCLSVNSLGEKYTFCGSSFNNELCSLWIISVFLFPKSSLYFLFLSIPYLLDVFTKTDWTLFIFFTISLANFLSFLR